MLFSRKHPITHIKPIVLDYEDIGIFSPREKGFDIGFRLYGDDISSFDKSYG